MPDSWTGDPDEWYAMRAVQKKNEAKEAADREEQEAIAELAKTASKPSLLVDNRPSFAPGTDNNSGLQKREGEEKSASVADLPQDFFDNQEERTGAEEVESAAAGAESIGLPKRDFSKEMEEFEAMISQTKEETREEARRKHKAMKRMWKEEEKRTLRAQSESLQRIKQSAESLKRKLQHTKVRSPLFVASLVFLYIE